MHKISGAIFLLIAVSTLLSVLARSILGVEFIGYYELMGILSGAAIMCSLVVAEKNSAHVRIDILKFRDHKIIKIGRGCLLALIYLSFAFGQFRAAYDSWFWSYKTIMLVVPIYILYLGSACCFAYLSILSIKKIAMGLAE